MIEGGAFMQRVQHIGLKAINYRHVALDDGDVNDATASICSVVVMEGLKKYPPPTVNHHDDARNISYA